MAMSLGSGVSRRKRGSSRRTPMSEINVTPFVDVMLVLLIIFMVTAPLLTAGVPIDLPDSRAKALAEEPRQITVSLNREGMIFMGDEPVTMAELGARIQSGEVNADGTMPLVTLRGDKGIDYGRVMAVMGELNRIGVSSISLVTNASGAVPNEPRPAAAPVAEPSRGFDVIQAEPSAEPLSAGSDGSP